MLKMLLVKCIKDETIVLSVMSASNNPTHEELIEVNAITEYLTNFDSYDDAFENLPDIISSDPLWFIIRVVGDWNYERTECEVYCVVTNEPISIELSKKQIYHL